MDRLWRGKPLQAAVYVLLIGGRHLACVLALDLTAVAFVATCSRVSVLMGRCRGAILCPPRLTRYTIRIKNIVRDLGILVTVRVLHDRFGKYTPNPTTTTSTSDAVNTMSWDRYRTACLISFHPISHPTPSKAIPSHVISHHPISYHSISYHSIPSHPI